jgi:hypothetical protein
MMAITDPNIIPLSFGFAKNNNNTENKFTVLLLGRLL